MNEIEINGETYIKKSAVVTQKETSDEVIVRTYSAGVHIGTLVAQDGQVVKIENARRLWNWSGAFTLNAVALDGVNRQNSRISKPVQYLILLQAIEIIPVSEGVDLSTTEDE